jgi:hypothetical protein
MPEAGWWPLFWRQAVILNNAAEHSIEDLAGGDNVSLVESYLEQNRKNIEHRTEMLIEQAKVRLAQHNAGTLPARIARKWSPGANRSAGLDRREGAPCPACGELGFLEGEEIHDRNLEHIRIDESEWESSVRVSVYAEYFSCSNCGLMLDRPELIEQAGLEPIFDAEGTEDDLTYFDEPEYGND